MTCARPAERTANDTTTRYQTGTKKESEFIYLFILETYISNKIKGGLDPL